MAVRHGYGKIAGTDALVFAYDTGDTKNSYKGEPTENLLTNPKPTSTTGFNRSGGTGTVTYDETEQAVKWEQTAYATWGTYFNFHPAFNGTLDTGSQYTFSLEYKSQNEFADSNIFHQVVQGNGQSPATTNTDITSDTYGEINGWKQYRVTFTPSNSGVSSAYNRFITGNRGTDVLRMWFRNIQFEKKPHATQFTAGTRSVSGSLLDLTGNNTINLTNLNGYDSNAALVHDGTDDYIHINPLNLDVSNGLSYEVIYSAESTYNTWGTYHYLLRFVGTTHYGLLHEGDSRGWRFDVPTSAGARTGVTTNSTNATAGAGYYHVAVSFDPVTGGKGYLNGEQIGSWSGGYTAYTPSSLLIGAETTSTRFWDGEIPVVKVYNRALTAGEVKNNYSHYKNRFGI